MLLMPVRSSVFAVVMLTLIGFAGGAAAQEPADPVVVSPEHYRVLMENEFVRVLDVRLAPGEQDKMHSHPSSAYFVMSGEKMTYHLPRSEKDGQLARGSVTLQGAIEVHSVENSGTVPIHLILFENKAAHADEVKGEDPVKVSSTMFRLVDQNERIRVMDVTIGPGERTETHAHQASAYYSLAAGAVVLHAADGTTTNVALRPSGAGFLAASDAQVIENTGTGPIHFLMFEFKP